MRVLRKISTDVEEPVVEEVATVVEDDEGVYDLDALGEIIEELEEPSQDEPVKEVEDDSAVEEEVEDDSEEEEVEEEVVKSTPVSKSTPKAADRRKAVPRSGGIRVATPNRLTLDELKAKASLNMGDLSTFIYTYLADNQPVTKKNVEDLVSIIFSDLLPTQMDALKPIRLGELRVTYSDVSGRVYENSRLAESLSTLGEFDTLVEPHKVARFKREINKISYRGKLSEDKKVFHVANVDEEGNLVLSEDITIEL